jgi:YD repeat-containing protein
MNVAAILDREASHAYDRKGNVTEVATTTFYTYDFDNRLTQSSIWNGTATTTTTYAYDPFGNRISQTASTTTTLYPSKYYSITTTTIARRPEPQSFATYTLIILAQRRSRPIPVETSRNGPITGPMGASLPARTRERPPQRGSI